ncbi:DUF4184 family protein [Actinocorallia sp. API 0066]|nr:DUF4184 family protein [Actinocorallia sp. API 0066]
MLGQATHLVWDGFTHWTGPFVELWPVLREDFGPLRYYRWGQYGSGVLGGLAVAVWLARWLRRAPRRPEPGLPWPLMSLVVLVTTAAAALGVRHATTRDIPDASYHLFRYAVTDAMVAASASLLAYALLYWAFVGVRKAVPGGQVITPVPETTQSGHDEPLAPSR